MQGLLRLRIPAPVARPQRSGELATSANSPSSQRKHFLHSSLRTPQTLPPAQPNPLKGFKGQEGVCCLQGTDDAFPFDPSCRKAALGPLGNGVQGAGCTGGEHSPSRAKALHSPMPLLLVFLLKFPADLAIWLDWQNKSGKIRTFGAGCCCATACYVYMHTK